MQNYSNSRKIKCCQGTWARTEIDCKGIFGNIFGIFIYTLKVIFVDGSHLQLCIKYHQILYSPKIDEIYCEHIIL